MPKFNLLAEGQQTLLETLAPKSRVEELEEEVDFLKSIIKLHSEQIAELKKAQSRKPRNRALKTNILEKPIRHGGGAADRACRVHRVMRRMARG